MRAGDQQHHGHQAQQQPGPAPAPGYGGHPNPNPQQGYPPGAAPPPPPPPHQQPDAQGPPPSPGEVFTEMDPIAKIIGFVMCGCFVLGVVLILASFSLRNAADDNTRQEDIDEFSNAAADYRSTSRPTLLEATMAVNTLPLTLSNEYIRVQGNQEGVPNVSHVVFAGNFTVVATSFALTVSAPGGASLSHRYTFPTMQTRTDELQCGRSQCTRDCGSDSYECSDTSMSNFCSTSYAGTWQSTVNRGDCDAGDKCGTCRYSGRLAHVCVPIVVSQSSFNVSTQYQSCFYPFTEQRYGPLVQNPPLRFSAISEDDPYIVLERVTKGSLDFGVSADEIRAAGNVVLSVGMVVAFLMAFGIVGIFFWQRGVVTQKRAAMAAAQGEVELQPYPGNPGAAPGQGAQHNPLQPGHASSQPEYHQQPPGYPPQHQQTGYPPQAQQQGGYPPPPPQQQTGYPPQPGPGTGYPPQPGPGTGYPPQPGPGTGYPPSQHNPHQHQ